MTQSWDFAIVAGCPLRRSARCSSQLLLFPTPKTCSRAGKMQRRPTRMSKALEQILWRSSLPWPSPSCYSSDAPKIDDLKWRTNSHNNKGVSQRELSQTAAGMLGTDAKPYPGEKQPAGIANFILCPSVCGIVKVILVAFQSMLY